MAPKKAAASKKKADSKTASNAAPRDAKKKGKVVVTSQEETIGSAPSDSKAQEQAEALKKVASTKRFERRASFLRQPSEENLDGSEHSGGSGTNRRSFFDLARSVSRKSFSFSKPFSMKELYWLSKHLDDHENYDRAMFYASVLYFAETDNVKAVKKLLEHSFDATVIEKSVDSYGCTALHVAARSGSVEMVKYLLLDYGMNPNNKDHQGRTPLDVALEAGAVSDITDSIKGAGGSTGSAVDPSHPSHGGKSATQEETALSKNIRVADVELESVLGEGAFGIVYKAKIGGSRVAVKRVRQTAKGAPDATEELEMELRIQKHLRHPNLVMLYGYYRTKKEGLHIVTSLKKTNLLKVLVDNASTGRTITREKARTYMRQIASGMWYLHSHEPPIIHRDLKPANVLIDHAGNLCLTDFGLCKFMPEGASHNDKYEMSGKTGAVRYMAPEVFSVKKYGLSADLYSFGILANEIIEGRNVDHAPTAAAAMAYAEKTSRTQIKLRWVLLTKKTARGEKTQTLVNDCVNIKPEARPTFTEVLKRLDEIDKIPAAATPPEARPQGNAGAQKTYHLDENGVVVKDPPCQTCVLM